MSAIKTFIDRRMYRITGFLHPTDAMALAGLAGWQNSNNITGSIMEIGVFYGRSFALLAKFLDPSTAVAIACDLFDIDRTADGDSLQLRSFKSLLQKEGISESSVHILQMDSMQLKPDNILSLAKAIRLFSIDGSHEENHVRSDAELAFKVLSDDGIIVFDDFFNPQYPGVTLAIIDFLGNQRSQVIPFLITNNKLYVCRASRFPAYRDATATIPLWAGAQLDQFKFQDDNIIYLFQSLSNRAIYQFMATLGFGNFGSTLIRARPTR
jgi:predicted O-methyltransferase YrrM